MTAQLTDGSVVTRTAWGHHIATETVPYNLLQDHTLAHSFPVPGRQRTEIGDELVNSFDWKYFVERSDLSGPVTQVCLFLFVLMILPSYKSIHILL